MPGWLVRGLLLVLVALASPTARAGGVFVEAEARSRTIGAGKLSLLHYAIAAAKPLAVRAEGPGILPLQLRVPRGAPAVRSLHVRLDGVELAPYKMPLERGVTAKPTRGAFSPAASFAVTLTPGPHAIELRPDRGSARLYVGAVIAPYGYLPPDPAGAVTASSAGGAR